MIACASMGIRLKINLLLVAALVVVLGVAGYLQLRITERLAVNEMVRRGEAMLAALSVPCSVALANHEIERLDDYLARFSPPDVAGPAGSGPGRLELPAPDLISLAIIDRRGRVLAHTRETEYGAIMTDEFTRQALASRQVLVERHRDGGRDELSVALPVRSGLRWGTLEARFSLARLNRLLARLRLHSLGVTALAILLASLALSLGLGRVVVRPVARLAYMAEKLRQGEFSQRLHLSSGDELGRLATAFDEAAQQLGDYTQRLEEKVRERSRQIMEKNLELENANKTLNEQASRLEQLATTDGLTGLANKRHWLERVGTFEVERARRGRHPLSMLMLDVDHFKHYNDNNGHLAGDQLLQQLARLLRDNLRSTDIAGRFGGEEFCVALLDTNSKSAGRVAEKIRRAVEKSEFPHQDRQPAGNLTVSIGVAELDINNDELADLIERADQALYRAKAAGRNRVET